ncbi:MAG: hypothetical protein AAF449_11840 [Myxococcota bacterium]
MDELTAFEGRLVFESAFPALDSAYGEGSSETSVYTCEGEGTVTTPGIGLADLAFSCTDG